METMKKEKNTKKLILKIIKSNTVIFFLYSVWNFNSTKNVCKELQTEFNDFQCNSFLKSKFDFVVSQSFASLLQKGNYNITHNIVKCSLCIFHSTDLCELLLS